MSSDSLETSLHSSAADKKNSVKTQGFNFRIYSTLIALMVLFVILGIVTEGSFLEARNFTNLTRQISINGILATGMTLIILTGGIDLSVGSVVALTGIIIGLLQVNFGLAEMGMTGTLLSVVGAIVTGLICGVINGGLITIFKIPPFIITLGMMVMARGFALIFSQSSAISPMSESFENLARGFIPQNATAVIFLALILGWLYSWKNSFLDKSRSLTGKVFGLLLESVCLIYPAWAFITDRGIPLPTFFFLTITFILFVVLRYFPFGRYLYALGGNEEAAYLSGVPVKKVKWLVYSIMGILTGITGVVLTARLNSATPTEGNLMELDAIAAVVIGGTSLSGGQGTLVGSILGAFLIGTLNNGMDLLGIDSNYQMVVKGLIIIFAVWSDARTKNK